MKQSDMIFQWQSCIKHHTEFGTSNPDLPARLSTPLPRFLGRSPRFRVSTRLFGAEVTVVGGPASPWFSWLSSPPSLSSSPSPSFGAELANALAEAVLPKTLAEDELAIALAEAVLPDASAEESFPTELFFIIGDHGETMGEQSTPAENPVDGGDNDGGYMGPSQSSKAANTESANGDDGPADGRCT